MFGPPMDPRLPAPGIPGLDARSASSGTQERPRAATGAVRLLLTEAGDGHRDRRRTSAAFVALVGMIFVLLNFVIYVSARSRLVSERWDQLVACTNEKRLDLVDVLTGLRRDARFVANQDEFRAWLAESRGRGSKPPLARSLQL